jgi:hypothetical protein
MIRRDKVRVLAVLALAMAALPVDTAMAGRKKSKITATVDGTTIKWKGRLVIMSYGEAGVFIVATKVARRSKVVPTIGFGCAVDLPSLQLPHTMTLGCSANFSEARAGIPLRSWLSTGQTVTVTFATFDGTRLTGSVTGTLEPVIGADGPITFDAEFGGKAVLGN